MEIRATTKTNCYERKYLKDYYDSLYHSKKILEYHLQGRNE
jgi:hypothetical protein